MENSLWSFFPSKLSIPRGLVVRLKKLSLWKLYGQVFFILEKKGEFLSVECQLLCQTFECVSNFHLFVC